MNLWNICTKMTAFVDGVPEALARKGTCKLMTGRAIVIFLCLLRSTVQACSALLQKAMVSKIVSRYLVMQQRGLKDKY